LLIKKTNLNTFLKDLEKLEKGLDNDSLELKELINNIKEKKLTFDIIKENIKILSKKLENKSEEKIEEEIKKINLEINNL